MDNEKQKNKKKYICHTQKEASITIDTAKHNDIKVGK